MENAIVGCIGMKGYGKSTLVKALVQPCRRAIFADPEGKWPMQPGDVEVRDGRALWALLGRINATDPAVAFRVVYRDYAPALAQHAPAAAFAMKNCTLVVDEVAWICKASSAPKYLLAIPQFGRERRVNLVWTSRRPQEIHNMLLDQADLIMFFHMEAGLGLDRVRKWNPEIAKDLPALGLHQYRARGNEQITALFGAEGLARFPRRVTRSPHNSTR